MNDSSSDRIRNLMMAALDDAASDEEWQELNHHLGAHPDAAAEWQRLRRAQEITKTMTPREPGIDVWQDYWSSVYRRLERGIGWIFFSVGAILLTAYGIWEAIDTLLRDTTVPEVVRIAMLLTFLGLAILLISVIREKIFANRKESYKDVTR